MTDYAAPDEGPDTRQPIPLSALGPHMERNHLNENCGFVEEYRVSADAVIVMYPEITSDAQTLFIWEECDYCIRLKIVIVVFGV